MTCLSGDDATDERSMSCTELELLCWWCGCTDAPSGSAPHSVVSEHTAMHHIQYDTCTCGRMLLTGGEGVCPASTVAGDLEVEARRREGVDECAPGAVVVERVWAAVIQRTATRAHHLSRRRALLDGDVNCQEQYEQTQRTPRSLMTQKREIFSEVTSNVIN